MVIIVTGGRKYKNEPLVRRVLRTLNPGVVLFGDATGADEYAEKWAKEHVTNHKRFRAHWDRYGKKAGPMRNREMIDYALCLEPWPIVMAFPGGRGTADCISQAHHMGLIVIRVEDIIT